ncbi:hypothetical protein PAPYR_2090 [Paratrimastix pyriformis]|uniref:RING-type domain-containing protein n=1 Tax=Paratrimastix pyriformis TaxID=342808 RepID=A0ABQ8UUT3_9EUKA|nr:hypothetical protein PAPYR_2090 [Paratrimastix pyriformis]
MGEPPRGIDPKVICPICKKVLKSPVSFPCKHLCCRDCMEDRIRENPSSSRECCLACGQAGPATPANEVSELIAHMSIHCSTPGCEWIGPVSEVDHHEQTCAHRANNFPAYLTHLGEIDTIFDVAKDPAFLVRLMTHQPVIASPVLSTLLLKTVADQCAHSAPNQAAFAKMAEATATALVGMLTQLGHVPLLPDHFRVLSALSLHPDIRAALCRAGVVPLYTRMYARATEDGAPALMQAAWMGLTNLAALSPENQKALGQAAGVAASLARALGDQAITTGQPKAFEQLLWALANLTAEYPPNRASFASAGLAEPLVRALGLPALRGSAPLDQHAYRLLGNLAEDAAVREQLGRAHVMDALKEPVRAVACGRKVGPALFRALGHLVAKSPANQRAFLEAGLAPVYVGLLADPAVVGAPATVLQALKWLVLLSEQAPGRAALLEAGLAPALAQVLGGCPLGTASTAGESFWALANLLFHPEYRAALVVGAGAAPALLRLVVDTPPVLANPKVAPHALRVLVNATNDGPNQEAFGRCGAGAALARLLQNPAVMGQAGSAELVLGLTANLTESAPLQEALGQSGLIPLLVGWLGHPLVAGSPDLAEQATLALEHLALCPANIPRLETHRGAVAGALAAIERNPRCPAGMKRRLVAIRRLVGL